MSSPVLALVGCGAVSQTFHIPALAKRPELTSKLILVDPDLDRAEAVRGDLNAAEAVTDYREVMSRIDGALVATPHGLHYPITMDLVRAGVHVLCEKPLAEKAEEVDEIVAAARENDVRVAVNQTRRLFSSFQAVRDLIASGGIGELREIHYELGEPFQWPAATQTYFGAKSGGRGVLFDTGAHIIDLICWWMGGRPEVVDYADDSHGGTEAVARIVLRHGEATAHVHLSWLTKLSNVYRVVGSQGSASGGVYEWSSYTRVDGAHGKPRKIRTDKASRMLSDFMDVLLANFTAVVASGADPLVSAEDVRPVVSVIDECYARRAPLDQPWHDACEVLAHV